MSESKKAKSWRTTALGILGAVAVLATAAVAQLDSDPATVPAWGEAIGVALVALGLSAARDHAVSSRAAKVEA